MDHALATVDIVPSKLPTSFFDIYRWLRPLLDSHSRRVLRLCSHAARAAHDREEPALHAKASTSDSKNIPMSDFIHVFRGILSRGCRPNHLALWLEPRDPEAQERGTAALACFPTAGVASVTQLAAQHLPHLTADVAAAVAAAAPGLAVLRLTGSVHLPGLPAVVLGAQSTLRRLSLEGCGGDCGGSWPTELGLALSACPNLEHLTLIPDGQTGTAAAPVVQLRAICEALTRLTQLQSLSMELQLPSSEDLPFDGVERYDGSTGAAAAAVAAAATLARGISALTRLTSLEVGEGGALPHPEWRLDLLHSLAGLPRLHELTWRRLECDPQALFTLAASSSLTSLSVEKFRTVAPLAAVALASTAAAAAAAAPLAAPRDPLPPRAAAAAAAAVAAVAAGRPLGGSGPRSASSQAQQQQQHLQLLLLPPQLRLLRARYSGLGGVSLAALAALQLPQGLTFLELRNPKLEIADGDVDQPAAARLLPEAALALGTGLAKLATHCPDLQVLRIINETRQRNALAGPVGWAEANGGRDGGAAGGGHAPWLAALGKLRCLRRLTLSGLLLGRLDAEALARHVTTLEDLYLVPMGSVSSAAVPVLQGMGVKRLRLPYERHA